jgi:hypothetical protein
MKAIARERTLIDLKSAIRRIPMHPQNATIVAVKQNGYWGAYIPTINIDGYLETLELEDKQYIILYITDDEGFLIPYK